MSKTEQAIDAAKPTVPTYAQVALDVPIIRGDQHIDTITLRKPSTGELRGIALSDLVRCDINALFAVLPRITSPTLTPHDVAQLDLADLASISGEIVSFFMSKEQRAILSPGA